MKLAHELLPANEYILIEGSTDFAKNHITDCEALLIRSETFIKDDILEYFPQLKHVIRVGVGLDNVDTEFLTSHNVKIHNAPGANSDAVAEYVVTMILSVLRHTTSLSAEDALTWNRMKFMGHSVTSQKVGIVGYGHIGRLLQEKLKGLGCTSFFVYDPYLPESYQFDEVTQKVTMLEELLQQATIVSLHLPLLESTRYILNDANLPLLQKGTILVNAARGGIVNENALLAVIDERQLTYVADTVENEPRVNPKLVEHDRVIVTPHIASLTEESNENMLRVATHNFLNSVE